MPAADTAKPAARDPKVSRSNKSASGNAAPAPTPAAPGGGAIYNQALADIKMVKPVHAERNKAVAAEIAEIRELQALSNAKGNPKGKGSGSRNRGGAGSGAARIKQPPGLASRGRSGISVSQP